MWIKLFLLGFLLLFLHYVANLILYFDVFKTVWNHQPGPCRIVPGIDFGSEDMQTLSSGLTFITSGVDMPNFGSRFKEYRRENNVMGRIYLFDFNHPDKNVTELPIKGDNFRQTDFAPHGISVIEVSGKILLFVVSHPPDKECIEKFQYLPEMNYLIHLHTYTGPAINVLNSVTATGENSFYYTNYCYFKSYLLNVFELMLGLPWGNIGYFDGSGYKEMDSGFLINNGIKLSKNRKYLYLMVTGAKEMRIYKREIDNSLTLTNLMSLISPYNQTAQVVQLYTGVDNPTVELETGNVLSAGAPQRFKMINHLTDPVQPAGSQVLMLQMDKTGSVVEKTTELFMDGGDTLYGASVASLYKKKLLIGTVFHKLMYCEVRTL